MQKKMTPAEMQYFKMIIEDPVMWAKAFVRTFDRNSSKHVPWVARDYQEEMLRDPSLKKVARCGRRTGKCLPGWIETIDTSTGARKTIEEIFKEGRTNIATVGEKYHMHEAETEIIFENGVKPVLRLHLVTGREIDLTGNHPLFTVDGWKNAEELQRGDLVAIPRQMPYFGNKTFSERTLRKSAEKILHSRSRKARVDADIFQLDKKNLALFLSLLRFESEYLFYSRAMAKDIQHLLLRFVINVVIERKNSMYALTAIEEIDDSNKSDLIWDCIESTQELGEFMTYDLSVPGTHNFVAADILTHNTETMIISALHKTAKNQNYRVLFCAPYENQVRLFFMRLRELIDASPDIKGSLLRMTQSPYCVTFSNGSSIMGFTTGAASGTGAASVRGQRADYILVDEMDRKCA